MAKLDKAQQAYALARIDSLAGKAIADSKPVTKKIDKEELVALLEKKGFTVNDRYVLGYIDVAQTDAQKIAKAKALTEHDKKVKEINSARDEAKDAVMLGDSAEVTKILAELAKKLGV